MFVKCVGFILPAVRPDTIHECLLETALFSQGYGVSDSNIRDHKRNHADEFKEGKHWVVEKTNTPGGKQNLTFWTKRGVIRLSFFIKSEQAKAFRDWAEDLVIKETTPKQRNFKPVLFLFITSTHKEAAGRCNLSCDG